MEFSQGAGFKLFGKFISVTPIQQPPVVVHDPTNLELQLTLPSIPCNESQREEKKEDDDDNNNNEPRKHPATIIKRLFIKLNEHRFRIIICDPRLDRVLQRMKVSGNHRLTHFFTRTLYKSDVSKQQARLTIPHNLILRRFLNDDEERLLRQASMDKDGRGNGLRVKVIDPTLEVRTLNLTRWNYAKKAGRSCSYNYVLNGAWNELVHGSRLSKKDVIHVWSFRRIDESLGFIIIKE